MSSPYTRSARSELFFWIILAVAVSLRPLLVFPRFVADGHAIDFLDYYSYRLIYFFGLILLPILYEKIFECYPLESLRRLWVRFKFRRERHLMGPAKSYNSSGNNAEKSKESISTDSSHSTPDQLAALNSLMPFDPSQSNPMTLYDQPPQFNPLPPPPSDQSPPSDPMSHPPSDQPPPSNPPSSTGDQSPPSNPLPTSPAMPSNLTPRTVTLSDYLIGRREYIEESKVISQRLYARSGVYLFIGSIIAFIGIFVFYFLLKSDPAVASTSPPAYTEQASKYDSALSKKPDTLKIRKETGKSPTKENTTNSAIWNRLIDYLPRFGALFFIEFIAFFFLKQYRIVLEEYRYYEAVKRKRQDDYNFILLVDRYKAEAGLLDIFKTMYTPEANNVLKAGETTQLLQVEKLTSDDLDILGKATEIIKAVKGK